MFEQFCNQILRSLTFRSSLHPQTVRACFSRSSIPAPQKISALSRCVSMHRNRIFFFARRGGLNERRATVSRPMMLRCTATARYLRFTIKQRPNLIIRQRHPDRFFE